MSRLDSDLATVTTPRVRLARKRDIVAAVLLFIAVLLSLYVLIVAVDDDITLPRVLRPLPVPTPSASPSPSAPSLAPPSDSSGRDTPQPVAPVAGPGPAGRDGRDGADAPPAPAAPRPSPATRPPTPKPTPSPSPTPTLIVTVCVPTLPCLPVG